MTTASSREGLAVVNPDYGAFAWCREYFFGMGWALE
jgi:hypothetical protein